MRLSSLPSGYDSCDICYCLVIIASVACETSIGFCEFFVFSCVRNGPILEL